MAGIFLGTVSGFSQPLNTGGAAKAPQDANLREWGDK